MTRSPGFTLVELLVVLALIGLMASIAVPGLLSARRKANEAAAMGGLRAIADAQAAFAGTCGHGDYATKLPQLASPPSAGGPPFLGPELTAAETVVRNGYRLTLLRGSDGLTGRTDSCSGVPAADLASSFFATAEPTVQGGTGDGYFWIGVHGVVFEDASPIVSTEGRSTFPGGTPAQTAPGQPWRTVEPPPAVVP